MAKVTYIYGDQKQIVEGKKGETLLQIGLDNGVPIEHACGGNGFCTTCMCEVQEGMDNLAELNDREEAMGVSGEPERLSCQAQVESDGEVVIELME